MDERRLFSGIEMEIGVIYRDGELKGGGLQKLLCKTTPLTVI